jgi:hypothetical protein
VANVLENIILAFGLFLNTDANAAKDSLPYLQTFEVKKGISVVPERAFRELSRLSGFDNLEGFYIGKNDHGLGFIVWANGLRKTGYTEPQALSIASAYRLQGIIVPASMSDDKPTLLHEAYHREYDNLSQKEMNVMNETFLKVINNQLAKKKITGEKFKRLYETKVDEFFAYRVQKFVENRKSYDEFESILRSLSPEGWSLNNRLLKNALESIR